MARRRFLSWTSVDRRLNETTFAKRPSGMHTERVRPASVGQPPTIEHDHRATELVTELDARHGLELFGLARRSGLSDEAAEDAVQEALLRLWLQVRAGVDVIDARAWTFRTLYRIAMDQHRVRRRVTELWDRLQRGPTLVENPDHTDRLSIWQHVDRLPTRQRQVLYLHYKADLTFEQIAHVVGITSSAARAHALLAKARLRERLGPQWTD